MLCYDCRYSVEIYIILESLLGSIIYIGLQAELLLTPRCILFVEEEKKIELLRGIDYSHTQNGL